MIQGGSSDDYCDAVYGPIYDTMTEKEVFRTKSIMKQSEEMSKKIIEMFYDAFPSLTPDSFIVLTQSTANLILSLSLSIRAESREAFIEQFVTDLRITFKKMNNFRKY